MARSALKNKNSPSDSSRKFFTLDEATRALVLIKRIAADIQSTQSLRLRIHGELSAGLASLPASRQRDLQSDFDRATDRLETLIEELYKIGVELKDPSRALIDFPAQHNGRDILLCWKAGEPTITHFHEPDAGYAGRKPIELLNA